MHATPTVSAIVSSPRRKNDKLAYSQHVCHVDVVVYVYIYNIYKAQRLNFQGIHREIKLNAINIHSERDSSEWYRSY